MRAQDFIQEAISFSNLKQPIQAFLENSVSSCMANEIPGTIKYAIERNLINNKQSFRDWIENILQRELPYYVVSLYRIPALKQTGITDLRILTNPNETSNGMAHGTTVYVNVKLIYRIIEDITRSMFYDDFVDPAEEDGFDYRYFYSYCEHYEIPYEVERSISILRDLIIHELVHVQQHAQQTGRETQYRSYLQKNKQDFENSIKRLQTEYDFKLYHASPQEIPAYAHNFALNLIDFATVGKPMDKMSINDIAAAYQRLHNYLKDFSHNEVYSRYKEFKQPGTREYKIYKRFLKLTYLELSNFLTRLKQRSRELQNAV